MNNQVQKAIEVLNQGGIIIFPTDTAFGIGCRMDNVNSIKRLFKIRNRPINQATPVLVNGLDMALPYLKDISQEVIEKLINVYWPGALTIVLNCKKDKVPELARGGGDNLGVRMPDSEIALKIITKLNIPILGPSANFHNDKTPYELKDLDKSLVKLVDYVVEGECKLKMASTVIDCTKNPWQVLRKGAVEVNILL